MNILVTGGAGYIGSHTVIELDRAGHSVIIVDNLSNSSSEVLDRLRQITGKEFPFYRIDCADKDALAEVFDDNNIDATIHFAGFKAVGESVGQPLRYYSNNLGSTLTLLELMQEIGVRRLIFSSSATVYGPPERLPVPETNRTGAGITNPYGRTKHIIEQILQDLVAADPSWRITILRYFNPVGAHESGLIGEDPNELPNNLLPYIARVAAGKLSKLSVYGDDYDTIDGTGVRDYTHVVDLAKGHVAASEHEPSAKETSEYNLGTGKGTSVLEAVKAFERASGKKIPFKVVARRPGDLAEVYADCSKANRELRWKAQKTFADACEDAWRWQYRNPNGFKS